MVGPTSRPFCMSYRITLHQVATRLTKKATKMTKQLTLKKSLRLQMLSINFTSKVKYIQGVTTASRSYETWQMAVPLKVFVIMSHTVMESSILGSGSPVHYPSLADISHIVEHLLLCAGPGKQLRKLFFRQKLSFIWLALFVKVSSFEWVLASQSIVKTCHLHMYVHMNRRRPQTVIWHRRFLWWCLI